MCSTLKDNYRGQIKLNDLSEKSA